MFDFSDDEDGESNFGWTGRKFKIHIKSKVCGINFLYVTCVTCS
jgi:hypothetical protein